MILTIAQLGITIFGLTGFLMVTRETYKAQVLGVICGLLANPFWWMMVITTEQYISIPVHLCYTYGWIRKAVALYKNRPGGLI
jgi:hypothetical protein